MITDEQKKMLSNEGIEEEYFDSCYISENRLIFSPIKDKDGKVIKTGKEIYDDLYGIDTIKQNKINELNKNCEDRIIYEFYSDADGTKKLYDFDEKHQLRIESLKNDIKNGTYTSVTYYSKGEDCHEYTSTQFLKLAQDGTNCVFNNTAKYKQLKKYVNSLTSSEEINKVTFDTVIPTV